MGLAEWFSTFCSNILVRDGGVISIRYKGITKRLNIDFYGSDSEISHSLYVGSYGRNTAIKGFSDVDMIFQLPISLYTQYNNYQTNGQSALLQAVKAAITKTYSTTSIKADGQVIMVSFADGLNFDVVPAFLDTDDSFVYPDANDGGHWRRTNPKPEIKAIRDMNNVCNYNLVYLCRMMKAWRNNWNLRMGGLLVDTLAYRFIINYSYKDKSYIYYDWMCRDFFDFMANQSSGQSYWIAPGSGQYVYKIDDFQSKAKRCYNISLEAIEKEKTYPTTAKQKWRDIFGYDFPS